MKRIISALAVLVLLSGCSATPTPDDTYRGAKQLARAVEKTEHAVETGHVCEVDDRGGREASRESNGYETAECAIDAGSENDNDAILTVIVATSPKGRSWIYDAPLMGAVFQDRGVLKSKTWDWEIQGSLDQLSKLQDELGGELTAGTRTE